MSKEAKARNTKPSQLLLYFITNVMFIPFIFWEQNVCLNSKLEVTYGTMFFSLQDNLVVVWMELKISGDLKEQKN